MKLAAYSDDPCVRGDGGVGAATSFALFLAGLGERVEAFTLLARVAPGRREVPVELPAGLHVVELPWWEDQSRPAGLLRALPGSVRRFWRVAGEVDCVLLFGPSPLGIIFAALTRLRGRRLVLGVRMDYVSYSAHRHPGNRAIATLSRALDAAWRTIARGTPTVVVGASLAQRYRRSAEVLDTTISLVRDTEVGDAGRRPPGQSGPIRILTVGRLDNEKNPLLLADILADLVADGSAWELEACGDGPLREALAQRAAELGVGDLLHLRGFVSPAGGLRDLYRAADMFLHVSWTEGVPQVLLEAWATGLPVVATDVGGVRAATGPDAGLLVGPGDAGAAAAALRRIADDPAVRSSLVRAGLELARGRTLEREADRVVAFVDGDAPARSPER